MNETPTTDINRPSMEWIDSLQAAPDGVGRERKAGIHFKIFAGVGGKTLGLCFSRRKR